MTDEQWAIIAPLIVKTRQGPSRLVTLDLRLVMNAILYVLRTGGQWTSLSREYPNFNSVYYPFHKWRGDGTWEQINTTLREHVRQTAGRKAQPSLAIIDSQSVKTTEVGERAGAKCLLEELPEALWERLEKIRADGGYEGAASRHGSQRHLRR